MTKHDTIGKKYNHKSYKNIIINHKKRTVNLFSKVIGFFKIKVKHDNNFCIIRKFYDLCKHSILTKHDLIDIFINILFITSFFSFN